jgi:ferritin-like metal-binding protein YciE
MAKAREWLIQWLRDAHAMEEQAETMLSGQASRLDSYPDLKQQIERHLEETRRQAQRLRTCLDRIGEGSSTLKDVSGKLMAIAQSVSGVFAGDEVMKGSLAGYIARVCEENRREEIAMADWLKNHLPTTTTKFLARAETDSDAAKR